MKYYKTENGYFSIDTETQVNANGSRVPTNILAYGRGPERANDPGSITARVLSVVDIVRTGLEVAATDVPPEWRSALGLVKVAPVCPMPVGAAAPEKANSPESRTLEQTVYIMIGVVIGLISAIAFQNFFK
jgi:hypothetical protein